jgi:hypothetical protein
MGLGDGEGIVAVERTVDDVKVDHGVVDEEADDKGGESGIVIESLGRCWRCWFSSSESGTTLI